MKTLRRHVRNRWGLSLSLLLAMTAISVAQPAPGLKKATVEELSGEVLIRKEKGAADQKAAVKAVIEGKDVIRTGKKSRAELEFADKSLCRLGSNTVFSFDPSTRDMAFTRGVALVHVPPGRGGARIATPAATAAIQGDTVVVQATRMPDGTPATQFTALSPRGGPTDGKITVTLNANPSVSFALPPGQLAVVPQNATSLSQVPRVEIDVGRFVEKSSLLRDMPQTAKTEVKTVVDRQVEAFTSGAAQRMEYAMVGNQVVKADANGNFALPRPAAFTPPPGTKINPDGSMVFPDGTTVSKDGTVTRPDGTSFQAPADGGGYQAPPAGTTIAADGTMTFPDGTTVSPDGTVTKPDGTTFNAGTGGMPSSGGQQFAMGPTGFQPPFDPSLMPPPGTLPGGNNPPPPPGPPPMPTAFFPLNYAFSFSTLGINTINTDNGYLFNGGTARTTVQGSQGIILAGSTYAYETVVANGYREMCFDTLALDVASITVQGSLPLRLMTANNSGAGNAITINATTLTLSTPASSDGSHLKVESIYNGGNIQVNGTVAAAGKGIDLAAPMGGKSINAGGQLINVSGAAGQNGGTVRVIAGGTATVGNIDASGGTDATGGKAMVMANTVSVGEINVAGGSSAVAVGGNGGQVVVQQGSGALTTGNIIAAGGAGVTQGGAGGSVNVAAGSINVPNGSVITAYGGAASSGTGTGGAGGNINLMTTATGSPAISINTATGATVLKAIGGNGGAASGGQGGAGGNIVLSAPTGGTNPIRVDNTGAAGPPGTVDAGGGTGFSTGANGTITAPQAPITTLNNGSIQVNSAGH